MAARTSPQRQPVGHPEIADYEVRRELLLAQLAASLTVLNALQI
jgi:hypothetical protein